MLFNLWGCGGGWRSSRGISSDQVYECSAIKVKEKRRNVVLKECYQKKLVPGRITPTAWAGKGRWPLPSKISNYYKHFLIFCTDKISSLICWYFFRRGPSLNISSIRDYLNQPGNGCFYSAQSKKIQRSCKVGKMSSLWIVTSCVEEWLMLVAGSFDNIWWRRLCFSLVLATNSCWRILYETAKQMRAPNLYTSCTILHTCVQSAHVSQCMYLYDKPSSRFVNYMFHHEIT
jgi:hypothetical protein